VWGKERDSKRSEASFTLSMYEVNRCLNAKIGISAGGGRAKARFRTRNAGERAGEGCNVKQPPRGVSDGAPHWPASSIGTAIDTKDTGDDSKALYPDLNDLKGNTGSLDIFELAFSAARRSPSAASSAQLRS
jgi:hypothetical protein